MGLYRTRDAGRSWTRLDAELDHTYFREASAADGRLYAAARSVPSTWSGERGPDAALFESTDGGDTFEPVSYPEEREDFVFAWTALTDYDGDVLAGTRDGTILRRSDGEWKTIWSVPASFSAFSVVLALL